MRILHHHNTGEIIYYPSSQTQEKLNAAVNFKAMNNDIYICSFPKSGSTWLQYIVWLISHEGQPCPQGVSQGKCVPFIDYYASEAEFTGTKGQRRIVKTHLKWKFVPYNEDAKYLYIARNPRDVTVSRSYHFKGFERYANIDCSVSTLYEYHMLDQTPYNAQCDHIGEWYLQRHNSNVLFLLYKDLTLSTPPGRDTGTIRAQINTFLMF